jgi:hypothetical protein
MKKRQAQKCKGAHQKTSDGKRGNTKNAKGLIKNTSNEKEAFAKCKIF